MASPAFLTSVLEQIRDFDQIDELIVIESLRAVASDSVGGLTDDLGARQAGRSSDARSAGVHERCGRRRLKTSPRNGSRADFVTKRKR